LFKSYVVKRALAEAAEILKPVNKKEPGKKTGKAESADESVSSVTLHCINPLQQE
jgi:hypothetical protein